MNFTSPWTEKGCHSRKKPLLQNESLHALSTFAGDSIEMMHDQIKQGLGCFIQRSDSGPGELHKVNGIRKYVSS